jgi:hypothetical protein
MTRAIGTAAIAVGLLVMARPDLAAQAPLEQSAIALRSHLAMVALDRYMETWNSRNPSTWATSLHFPHVRPGPGAFELSQTAAEYAAGVDFEATLKTGWHHSEWISREVLQVGVDKVHAAGVWQRYAADGRPLATSAITYVITNQNNHWGVQSRFAAGVGGIDATGGARNGAAAVEAVNAFMQAWNGHDPAKLADTLHYPHVRVADGMVEVWATPAAYLAGPEPGRQRTWFNTRLDGVKVVQVTANGVNVIASFSKIGRDGRVLSKDEGLLLVTLRENQWRVQARSMMGS